MNSSSDVAFTPSVKVVQARLGSRALYERVERDGGWATTIDDSLSAFIAEQRSFFLATATADGQPYIQHRGGPPGFLKVLDEHTLGFADLRGNKQYLSIGNLTENPKVHLFLIDYAQRTRVKIWGTAKVIEDDPALVARLSMPQTAKKAERAFVIHVTAWDANCPQHIPQRFEADDVARVLAERDARIAALEAELARLR